MIHGQFLLKYRKNGKRKHAGKIETQKKSKKKSARKKLYALHTWLGFHLAFIMTLVLFTGSFAVISNEIDWLIQDDMRVTPVGEMVSWGEMESAARLAKPNDTLESISAMQGDHFAYRASMRDEYGRLYFLHINQWTGAVTGTTPWLTVQRFFRDFHRYLFMPRNIGLPLVTSLAFILAISLYTGLKTTRKWRTIATRIRFNKGMRITIGDSHKAVGIWGSWFFIVIIVTGIWYLAEFTGGLTGHRFSQSLPNLTQQRVEEFGPVIKDTDADTLILAANKSFPELKVRSIRFAVSPSQPVSISGRNHDFLIRDRANQVLLDPVDASVITIQRAKDIGVVSYLNEVADPLHFGYFGRLPTKIIWFLFGIAMTGLSVSGVWLTWKRLKTKSVSGAQFATMPILIFTTYCGVIWYQKIAGPIIPKSEKNQNMQIMDGIDAKLLIATDANDIPTGIIRLIVSADGRPNIKEISFSLPENNTKTIIVRRQARRTEVRTEFPISALCMGKVLKIKIEFNHRKIVENKWELSKMGFRHKCQSLT